MQSLDRSGLLEEKAHYIFIVNFSNTSAGQQKKTLIYPNVSKVTLCGFEK